MIEDSKPTLHAGIVIMKSTGKKIADVDYWMDDFDKPCIPLESLSALPPAPERLVLEMDDGRVQPFQWDESTGMIYNGPPEDPNEDWPINAVSL